MTIKLPSFDVIVVGAGPAGCAAAIAAASAGASVELVERDPEPGGNVAQALVHTICGLYLPSPEHRVAHAHPGLPKAISRELERHGDAGAVEWAGAAGFLPVEPVSLARTLGAWCRSAGVTLYTGARSFTASIEQARTSRHINLGKCNDPTHSVLVDATGDAALAAAMGVPLEAASPEELQHPSWIFRLGKVDTKAFDAMEPARASMAVARAAKKGRLPARASSIVLRRSRIPGNVYATLNLEKPPGFDALDPASLESLHRSAAADADEVVAFLRAERPAFADAEITRRPARPGIRETRRVRGLARLEAEDLLEARRRDDEVCVSTWPIEIWSSRERMSFRQVPGPASIPLGCLVADHPSRRLAMAGRCVSASHEALGGLRVIGTALAMGEAAGVAAAEAARRGCGLDEIEPAFVRERIASGATLRSRSD